MLQPDLALADAGGAAAWLLPVPARMLRGALGASLPEPGYAERALGEKALRSVSCAEQGSGPQQPQDSACWFNRL